MWLHELGTNAPGGAITIALHPFHRERSSELPSTAKVSALFLGSFRGVTQSAIPIDPLEGAPKKEAIRSVEISTNFTTKKTRTFACDSLARSILLFVVFQRIFTANWEVTQ